MHRLVAPCLAVFARAVERVDDPHAAFGEPHFGVLAFLGQKAVVHYVVDPLGLIQDVWILTDAERAKQPWPTTAKDAQTWSFDPVAQVWTPR